MNKKGLSVVNPLTLRSALANGKKRFHLEFGLFSANSFLFDKEIEHESSFALSGFEIENPAEGTVRHVTGMIRIT
jgi:hypothetical protein